MAIPCLVCGGGRGGQHRPAKKGGAGSHYLIRMAIAAVWRAGSHYLIRMVIAAV